MKKLSEIFLILVFTCVFLLSSLLFTANYKLEREHIESNVSKEKTELFLAAKSTQILLNKEISGNYKFIAQLKPIFEECNEEILRTKAISASLLQKVVDLQSNNSLSKDKFAEFIKDSTSSSTVNLMEFETYISWLYGKEFQNKSELFAALNTRAIEFNQQQLEKHGFSDYETKTLLLQLTKVSETSLIFGYSYSLFWVLFGLIILFGILSFAPSLIKATGGIKNDGVFHDSVNSRGLAGIILGTYLIVFYIILYWFSEYLTPWINSLNSLSQFFKNQNASQWFLYGFFYTVVMLVMGFRMLLKYKNNMYQKVRTISVMFFQTAFAFLIPEILLRLNLPYFDFKNIWPLDYDFFFSYNLNSLLENGTLGVFMLGWGIALFVIAVPILTYFFGKRWYCSWVCGCGGLAETLGDPFRQLSDKSLKAWKIERILINSVLVFAVVMTGFTLYTFFTNSSSLFGISTSAIQKTYGFVIGSAFAGVVGTGFYPLMGNRVWCRFGCPLAAYLGIVQRFKSKFRITTNGGQCISCGNCSTYCEMGIDVKAYAQKGQDIVRSSCVGCGVCSAVCPRGVLKLENLSDPRALEKSFTLGNDMDVS